MKKCPFCQADIEENARFCLYCMTSFEKKQVIETPNQKNKRWLVILAAVLVFVLIVCICLALLKNTPSETPSSSEFQASSEDNSNTTLDIHSTNSSRSTNGTTTTTTATNKNDGISGGTTSAQNRTPHEGQPQTTNQSSTAKPTTTETTTKSKQDTTTALNKPTVSTDKTAQTGSGSSSSASTTKPSASTVTYTYRDATYGDDFSVYANLENSVVITGVSSISPNGEYSIPETINGKTVVAIMESAFCDDHIKNTVKKVVIPKTVKTIWNYAFADCYNLTDIYFCGKSIYTEAQAFAESSKRTGTLTIHCSADCSDRNLRYYRNSAANYDAHYEEWNG